MSADWMNLGAIAAEYQKIAMQAELSKYAYA
jgi:hypothetical protein